MSAIIHANLLNALTSFDRKQSTKRGYNNYALGHYCNALAKTAEMVEQGYTLRKAIISNYVGRLCDVLLKAVDCELMSREELRG